MIKHCLIVLRDGWACLWLSTSVEKGCLSVENLNISLRGSDGSWPKSLRDQHSSDLQKMKDFWISVNRFSSSSNIIWSRVISKVGEESGGVK